MVKKLIKFTDAYDGHIIYIDPADVSAVKEVEAPRYDPNAVNTTTGTVFINNSNHYTPPQPYIYNGAKVILYLYSGTHFQLTEHIAEVLALLQDQDPTPARVIFGKE